MIMIDRDGIDETMVGGWLGEHIQTEKRDAQ
jgi:hypothetical protein